MVLRELVGESLLQGFPDWTLSAKTVLFFRLESDLSLLKGRASFSEGFSARWYGMSSPLLQCATGISVLLFKIGKSAVSICCMDVVHGSTPSTSLHTLRKP